MKFRPLLLRVALALASGLFMAAAAQAQAYPSKPITLVVGYSPGGATDTLARTLADKLQQRLGQTVLVDNRPGASTTIATNLVRRAAPDGHTLYVVTSQFGQMPVVSPSIAKYNPTTDFSPIAQTNAGLIVLVANPKAPFNTVKEMLEYAKRNPGKLSVATTGIGSTDHLAGELLAHKTGTQFNFVPYKGGAPAVQDVIGGVVDLRLDAMPSSRPHIETGKLKALAVMERQRSPAFPNIPAIAESVADVAVNGYFGVVGPKGMSAAIVQRLNQELTHIMKMPDVVARMTSMGMDAFTGTPDQFGAAIQSDFAQWDKLIKDTGLKIE